MFLCEKGCFWITGRKTEFIILNNNKLQIIHTSDNKKAAKYANCLTDSSIRF